MQLKDTMILIMSWLLLPAMTTGITACSNFSTWENRDTGSLSGGLGIALEYLKSSPTFEYDGISDSIELVDIEIVSDGWDFTFKFQTRHPGHGDRTDAMLLQVITNHTARITVHEGKVISCVCCEAWDMVK